MANRRPVTKQDDPEREMVIAKMATLRDQEAAIQAKLKKFAAWMEVHDEIHTGQMELISDTGDVGAGSPVRNESPPSPASSATVRVKTKKIITDMLADCLMSTDEIAEAMKERGIIFKPGSLESALWRLKGQKENNGPIEYDDGLKKWRLRRNGSE
jgi:hypothetical protein